MQLVSAPVNVEDITVGLSTGYLMLEVVGVWVSVDDTPVNSTSTVFGMLGMATVDSMEDIVAMRVPEVDETSMFVALDPMELVLRAGIPPIGLLGLENADIRREQRPDGRIGVLIGEDFGLAKAVTEGVPLDETRITEAAMGRRLLGGIVVCR